MSFCPICKCNHDPGVPCFYRDQVLHSVGNKKDSKKKAKTRFNKIEKEADKFMKKFFIISSIIIFFSILVLMILSKFF